MVSELASLLELSSVQAQNKVSGAQVAAQEGTPKEDVEGEPPEEVGAANTVTSALSVQEYFARRMAKLKKAQPRADAGSVAPPSATVEPSACLEPQARGKKCRKHRELENERELELLDREKLDSFGGEVADLEKKEKKKKKRRKFRRMSLDRSQGYKESPKGIREKGEVYSGASDAENNAGEVLRPKKKHTKKHKKRSRGAAEGVQRQKKPFS